jgi:HK97 gp10 family phage protein
MARPVVYDTVSVEGFKELEKELERLGGIAAKKAVARAALRKAMQPMHKMAVSRAPDDPRTPAANATLHTNRKTGKTDRTPDANLKTSIKIGSSVKIGRSYKKMLGTKGIVEIYMGPTKDGYPQATLMEFGVPSKNIAPRGYMRGAWEAHSRNAVNIIKKEMWAGIAKKAKKLGV